MRPILKKRGRVRSGIRHYPERAWPKHRRFVASHECVVACLPAHLQTPCQGQVRACHWRTAATAGTGLKSHDWQTWPGCDGHHAEEHRGTRTFEARYGLDLDQIAAQLAARSPDFNMRSAMKGEPSEGGVRKP